MRKMQVDISNYSTLAEKKKNPDCASLLKCNNNTTTDNTFILYSNFKAHKDALQVKTEIE